jgi:hypothetical protein
LATLTVTSQLPASAGTGKTLAMVRSGRPLSASTQSAKNQERSVLAGAGLLESFSKGWAGVAAVALADVGGGIVGAEGGGEGGVAGDFAQHPEDVSGFGAVVDGGDGLGEGLAEALAGAFGLGEGEGGAGGFKGAEGLVAAALLFSPERAHEVGYALAEPGAGDCIQAWVRAWARMPLSWFGPGLAARMAVASMEPVS